MIIHLGDETRAEVIDSVLGQLSDGIWENSGAMNKYWMFADVEGTDLVIDDEPFRDEQGWGRYGSTRKRIQNGFSGKSEKQIKDWFANKAKQVVKIWAEDGSKDPKYIWNRANDDDIVDYMGGHKVRTITVADVYECYDFLKGRSGKKYGIAADPLPYEVECSTKRTFTKYPRYVKASTSNIKYVQSESYFSPEEYDYSLPLPKHIGFCGCGGRSWVDINSNNIDTWDSCEEAIEDAKKNYKPDTRICIYKIDMDTRTILEFCEEVYT